MNESEHKKGRLGWVYYRSGKRGIWQISYQNDQGKEVRKSAKTSDETRAAKFLEQERRKVIATQHSGEVYESPQIRRQLVARILDAWEVQCKLQGRFNDCYRTDKKQLLERFGSMPADAITKARIQEWQLQEKAG